MKYLIKAITTNNRDLKTAIYFMLEEKAYLFNCPDGFQRMALNQKMKFKNVRYVFLSNVHPDYYGGFPGFYLSTREASIADLQTFKIGVLGPALLKSIILQGRSFIGSLNLMEVYEYGKLDRYMTEVFQDGKFVPQIKFHQTHKPLLDNGEEYKISDEVGVHDFQDDQLKVIPVRLESTDGKEMECYSFICVPKQAKGKFLPKKALELGLNPAKHFNLLHQGIPVTLEDGNIVYPFQVMDNPNPSQAFIFFFIPNEEYLDSLLSDENVDRFKPYFAENIDSAAVQMHLIYHSVPLKVLLNDKYKQFMYKFGLNVQHIIDTHETNDEVIAKAKAYALSNRHKIVCPSLIPLSNEALRFYSQETKDLLDNHFQDFKYVNSQVGMVYNLYPLNQQGIDTTSAITMKDVRNEIEEDIQNELRQTVQTMIKVKQKDLPAIAQGGVDLTLLYNTQQDIDDKEPSILFLGTISMKPTMYRAASAIYLFIKGKGLLMDCAEGSYGQIYDHFLNIEKVNEAIIKLRVVFITHIHGDHQLGIIKIMVERDKLLTAEDPQNKLYIVIPTPMYKYVDEFRKKTLKYPNMVCLVPSNDLNPEKTLYYDQLDESYNPCKGPYSKQLTKGSNQCPVRSYEEVNQILQEKKPKQPESIEMHEMLASQMNINFIRAIEVDHCIESYGCLIDSPDFGRIFYSGDTKPCQTIYNYAQKVTLLIHEATFDDSLEKDADYKKHTTMRQAIEVGQKVGAWRTVLTHFSPRYQKIAETNQMHIDNKVMVAFDHMRLKLSHFEWAYNFLDIYGKLFTNDDVIEPTSQQKPQEIVQKNKLFQPKGKKQQKKQ